jgi:outer membrane protein assembly factor BamB
MEKSLFKKTLVMGILFLLIGIIITPNIVGISNETNDITEKGTNGFQKTIKNIDKQSNPTIDTDWWSMWRHSSGNDGSTTSIAPNTNQLNWKEKISDEFYSTAPVVYDDNLYISTGFYYDWIGASKIAEDAFLNPPEFTKVLNDLVDYKEEYFGGLYCLDADTGESKWDFPLYAPNDPLVVDNKVFVTDLNTYSYSSNLYCLDAENGDQVWSTPIGSLVTTPTIGADDKIFLGCLDFYSYNSAIKCYNNDGGYEWSYYIPPTEIMWFTTPAYCDGKVYFLTSNMYSYYSGRIYCLDAETGGYLWSQMISTFFIFQPSPVCRDGKVFVTELNFYSYSSSLRCFEANTGSTLWQYPLGYSLCFATPAVNDDSAFIGAINLYTYNSYLYRINTDTGIEVWKVPIPGIAYFYSSGSPSCSANKIFISPWEFYGYSDTIYCLNIENGAMIWSYNLDYYSLAYPSIADERVYIADSIGNIYAIEDLLKIGKISGGLLSVKAEIKNIGVTAFNDVSWDIDVVGGMMGMINKHANGVIPTLEGGKSNTVRAFPIIGIGNIDIQVSVSMTGLTPIIKNLEGMAMGFLVMIKS